MTDSGSITEETTVLGVPCLTLRDNTERRETVTIGTTELIGTDPRKLPPAQARLIAWQLKKARFFCNGMDGQPTASPNIARLCFWTRDARRPG
ncbi:MAG: UDP-N-acetylglucosamine 2-epimerase [Nitrospira sp.]|nr:UDP-N-acetylglucosamine 2-epimerase [Nitrospira sp.]